MSNVRKTPQQTRSQAMVEAIIEAAAKVLAKKGYANTNTNLVAQEANISIGSFYQYFPNKNALIGALYLRHYRQMQELIESTVIHAEYANFREALRMLVHRLLSAQMKEPELQRALQTEFPIYQVDHEAHESGLKIFELTEQFLKNYRHELVDKDSRMMAYVLLETVSNLIRAFILEPLDPALSMEAIENEILDVLHGYLLKKQ